MGIYGDNRGDSWGNAGTAREKMRHVGPPSCAPNERMIGPLFTREGESSSTPENKSCCAFTKATLYIAVEPPCLPPHRKLLVRTAFHPV